jgi:hypothetical protein
MSAGRFALSAPRHLSRGRGRPLNFEFLKRKIKKSSINKKINPISQQTGRRFFSKTVQIQYSSLAAVSQTRSPLLAAASATTHTCLRRPPPAYRPTSGSVLLLGWPSSAAAKDQSTIYISPPGDISDENHTCLRWSPPTVGSYHLSEDFLPQELFAIGRRRGYD